MIDVDIRIHHVQDLTCARPVTAHHVPAGGIGELEQRNEHQRRRYGGQTQHQPPTAGG
ncbi:Uncharacterised protein [Mycobacteroides abscessus subsp. massiliense]|nr:Uncharacterised protein [Mycobacteroides abscessus subsp. massiliense]